MLKRNGNCSQFICKIFVRLRSLRYIVLPAFLSKISIESELINDNCVFVEFRIIKSYILGKQHPV